MPNKKTIDTNKIYYSNTDHDPYKIIKEYEDVCGNGISRKCRVKFINSNYEYDVLIKNAINGKVKDPYSFDIKILNDNNIYHSNNCGDFYYVRAVPAEPYKHRRVIVHFINTGSEIEVQYSCAKEGKIKDPYCPLESGLVVGIPKNIYPDYIMKNLYNKWRCIGDRCYNKKSSNYKYYGENDVKMCDEWMLFETFIETIHLVDGFYEYLNNPNNYDLDKDIKQINCKEKIYSPQTCMFVPHRTNMLQSRFDHSQNKYYGVYKTHCGNFKVVLNNNYIGTFSNEIAAANAYNYFAKINNLPVILNNVPYMMNWSLYKTTNKIVIKRVEGD